jgi:hypothetical protein
MEPNMSDDKLDLLCEDCGQTFADFLHEMADQNAKVTTCPKSVNSLQRLPRPGRDPSKRLFRAFSFSAPAAARFSSGMTQHFS